MTKSVLFVLTSNAALGDTGRETGYWLAEAAHPWKVFTEAGYSIDLASIKGGLPPVEGVELDDPDQVAFLQEPALQKTLVLADVDPSKYDAVLYVGGHGSMWDFPGNPDIARIGAHVYDAGGVLAAVCHGPAGRLDITLADGSRLLDGKAVTSFSNAEEAEISLDVVVPFLLQDALTSRGASYSDAGIFQPSVVVSDRLVTGQNPPSADGVAREVVKLLG
ncbi:type 1 glutamine amidotransferase domain-containing protein [soil metagenome]